MRAAPMRKLLLILILVLAFPAVAQANYTFWFRLHRGEVKTVCSTPIPARDEVAVTPIPRVNRQALTVGAQKPLAIYYSGNGTLLQVTASRGRAPMCVKAQTWLANAGVWLQVETVDPLAPIHSTPLPPVTSNLRARMASFGWVCTLSGALVAAGVGIATAGVTGILAGGGWTAGCELGANHRHPYITVGLPNNGSCWYVFRRRRHHRTRRIEECVV